MRILRGFRELADCYARFCLKFVHPLLKQLNLLLYEIALVFLPIAMARLALCI